ncbi:MAG: Cation efflux protein [Candidatus Moranbacteria bacterium GW2011_GWD2_36_12]|nr:MAG: Cation efflux protein [Candidatus Moranbacteria bacterium GW2011_GWD2_36_12]KKQ06369.1 MAG: Cation efflux protein [Candidatus Moranbacteria bacterium GW2011_GWE2_36_40]
MTSKKGPCNMSPFSFLKYAIILFMNTKNSHGFLPVFAALTGNVFIMILKWIGFFMTGSSALFSEAIHSIADVVNQILLMVGIKKSQRPSDEDFHYGYGNERFFWALISACSIFFLGAGITLYHGLMGFLHEEKIQISSVAFVILAISFVIEAGTFSIALRELRSKNKKRKWKEIFAYGDPTTIAVLLEDAVAVLGVSVAFVSIFLSKLTGNAYWDSIGSIIIGLLLGGMAVVLIAINRGFLMRKSIPEEIEERVIEILLSDPAIEKVLDFKSVVMDVGIYHVKCEVEFNGSALMRKMYREKALKKEFEEIKNEYNDFLKFCVNYADRVPRMIGTRIDEVEKKIKDEIPHVGYIDIEVN